MIIQEIKATSLGSRNTLNDLTGGQWLYFTKTTITTNFPSEYGHELRRAHGANKPPRLMKILIEFFTKGGERVSRARATPC